MSTTKTPACLFGAGMLGHTWVGTLLKNGDERILIQASYGADAARALDEYKGSEIPGRLFERVSRKKWVQRTRGYALLDQAPGRPYEPASEGATQA